MLTEKAVLIEGVSYGGKQHREVILRVPLVKDAIEAEKETEGKGVLVMSLALIAKSIVSWGSIPKEKITPDLLAELIDEDVARLQEIREYLKKKVHWRSADID